MVKTITVTPNRIKINCCIECFNPHFLCNSGAKSDNAMYKKLAAEIAKA